MIDEKDTVDPRYPKDPSSDWNRAGEGKQTEVNQCATSENPNLYHWTVRQELEHRRVKLMMELELIESALRDITPETETVLRVVKTLSQLGIRTRL